MNIPFLLFEMDFDAELFKKYYGSIDNPGVYAIPEDESEPSSPEEQQQENPEVQPQINQEQPEQQQVQNEPLKLQFNQDELAAADKEIEPIKKIFLLNKLSELQTLLKNQMMTCNELNVVLKFGGNLSYKTLQVLAMTIINQVQQMPQIIKKQQEKRNQHEQQVQEPEGQPQQQEQQVVQN